MIPQLKGFYSDATPSTFTAAADQVAGDVIVVQGRVGMVVKDVASGAEGVAIFGTDVNGIEMPKATGVCTKHDDAYWDEDGDPVDGDSGTGAVTATASGNLRIGRFATTVVSGAATVVVELTNE